MCFLIFWNLGTRSRLLETERRLRRRDCHTLENGERLKAYSVGVKGNSREDGMSKLLQGNSDGSKIANDSDNGDCMSS